MSTNLRVVLEGKYEQVEQAALRWAKAAEDLRDDEWDRRRAWAVMAGEAEGERAAVEALERKSAATKSAEGAQLLARYRSSRQAAERVLSERVRAFGGSGAGGAQVCARQLAEHLPLQCSHNFVRPRFLVAAILLGVGSVLLGLFYPVALWGLTAAVALGWVTTRRLDRVTVTQQVLRVNDFAARFGSLESVTLSQSGAGYVLIALLKGGGYRSWWFDRPLTDVVEVLHAEGVPASACPVKHVFGEQVEDETEVDWFDQWVRRG
jgi:hypothetical protein